MKISELRVFPLPGEAVYQWEHPDTLQRRAWAIDRIVQYLGSTGHPEQVAEIDVGRAKFFVSNRGIEPHRVQRLVENPQWLTLPCVVMRLDEKHPNGLPVDLFMDGHHRYVTLALLGVDRYPFYHIDEEIARPYELEDIPPTRRRLDPTMYSGL